MVFFLRAKKQKEDPAQKILVEFNKSLHNFENSLFNGVKGNINNIRELAPKTEPYLHRKALLDKSIREVNAARTNMLTYANTLETLGRNVNSIKELLSNINSYVSVLKSVASSKKAEDIETANKALEYISVYVNALKKEIS